MGSEEKPKLKVVTMSEEMYRSMAFGLGSPGVCLACGEIDEFAGCEPDAENYECGVCEENQLFGLEQALIMGHIEFEEDDDEGTGTVAEDSST